MEGLVKIYAIKYVEPSSISYPNIIVLIVNVSNLNYFIRTIQIFVILRFLAFTDETEFVQFPTLEYFILNIYNCISKPMKNKANSIFDNILYFVKTIYRNPQILGIYHTKK